MSIKREELIAQGCVEKKTLKGRKYFEFKNEVIALECSKCKSVKASVEFSIDKKSFNGVRSMCKFCESTHKINHRAENLESYLLYEREMYIKHADAKRKKSQFHKIKNPDYYRQHYIKNRDYYLEVNRKYRQEHPDRMNLNNQLRRARKKLLPNDLSPEQVKKIECHFGNTCALSGNSNDLHFDHVIPIVVGHGGTTYSNMIPLAKGLNHSKYDHHIFDWFDANRERFGLEQHKFDELIEYLAEINEMTPSEYRKYVDWCFDNPREFVPLKQDRDNKKLPS